MRYLSKIRVKVSGIKQKGKRTGIAYPNVNTIKIVSSLWVSFFSMSK
jgi:hypothetical protein